MKRTKWMIMVLLLCVLLTGCKDSYNDNHDFVEEINLGGREFKVIPGTSTIYGGYEILVDKDTRVQYLVNYQNGTEVIVDAEGKPILYEGDVE